MGQTREIAAANSEADASEEAAMQDINLSFLDFTISRHQFNEIVIMMANYIIMKGLAVKRLDRPKAEW